MQTTLFQSAWVVDPSQGTEGMRDVLACDGRIKRVADSIGPEEAGPGARIVDCTGLWMWPGLVDVHVHFREPGYTYKETIRTGSRAAAAGGYTSVVCEPNTKPPIDCVDVVRDVAETVAADSCVRVYLKAAMTRARRGVEPTEIAALAGEEIVVALSDDGDPVVDARIAEQVCAEAARCGIVVSPHEEDSPHSLEQLRADVDPGFAPAPPYENEINYIARDLAISARTGCRLHVSHVSLAASVAAIKQARAASDAGAVTFEVAPHHLLLCREDFGAGRVPKVNPPLRSAGDRDALVRALMDGVVDAIASDHAPHSVEDVMGGASGLVGLETTLGLVLTHFTGPGKLSGARAVELMSLQPARILGLPAGTLAPGAAADIVLVDPELSWTVDPKQFLSKGRNCPFAGWKLKGKAVATYVGGEEAFADRSFERAGRRTG